MAPDFKSIDDFYKISQLLCSGPTRHCDVFDHRSRLLLVQMQCRTSYDFLHVVDGECTSCHPLMTVPLKVSRAREPQDGGYQCGCGRISTFPAISSQCSPNTYFIYYHTEAEASMGLSRRRHREEAVKAFPKRTLCPKGFSACRVGDGSDAFEVSRGKVWIQMPNTESAATVY